MNSKENIDLKSNLNSDVCYPEQKKKPDPINPRLILSEQYPRIMKQIRSVWGSMELHKYFMRTLFSDRQDRKGFPPEVMSAIMQLHTEHMIVLRSKGYKINDDIWSLHFEKRK